MARVDTLSNFLTDVADAIRTKTGGTESIDAADFDTAILSVVGESAQITGYLTFQSDTDFSFYVNNPCWDGTLYTSTDAETWEAWDGDQVSCNDQSHTLYVRGTGNTIIGGEDEEAAFQFADATNLRITGDVETLLDWETVVDGGHPSMDEFCFAYLFAYCDVLVTAPSLPATTLSPYCYQNMFFDCTALTTPPSLPATTLATYCYSSMFQDCTGLTTAPSLPATTLAAYCYSHMFNGCASLTTAPSLPATTMENYCYRYMFYNCTALATAPSLPATVLSTGCYNSVFYNCTSLTTPPSLPATTLEGSCYYGLFRGCTSLTTAPSLPATTLGASCYRYMFNGCTSLKVSDASGDDYPYEWRIPASGTIDIEPSTWNTSMLTSTGGTYTSVPSINTTYYLENEPVS